MKNQNNLRRDIAKNSHAVAISKIILGFGLVALSQTALATQSKDASLALNLSQSETVSQQMIDDRSLVRSYKGSDFHTLAKPTVFNGDIRELSSIKKWLPGDPVKVANPRHINNVQNLLPPVNPITVKDSFNKQQQNLANKAPTDLVIDVNQIGFEFNGVNPPDPTGDIGEDYYIHAANSGGGSVVQIYNKADGNAVGAAFNMQSLAGDSDCQTGAGDPVVIYDEQAKRWLLTEFSDTGNKMCVYISQSSDPVVGGWYSYAFQTSSFPDYPKYSVWGDAYFISANQSGGAVFALERNKMLNGEAVTLIRKAIPGLAGFGFQSITPIDVDGIDQPDAGSPGLFIRHKDDELHNSGSNDGAKDFLEIWQLTPDFINAENTILEGPINIDVGEFDSDFNCSSQHFGCLTQKDDGSGLSTLDPLREVVNYKAQYRKFQSHESIVGTFVSKRTDNTAELRWFELRVVDGSWSLYDEGNDNTNDNNSRFMAGAALDGDGNMALAYMSTGVDRFPGVKLSGRRFSDELGAIAEEISIVDATGGIASDRAGDYSQMSVDPVDNCTFWYTSEQGGANGRWKTRVASFKYADCTGVGSTDPGYRVSSSHLTQEVCLAGDLEPIAISVTGYNGFSQEVNFSYSGLVEGLTGSFSVNPVTAEGTTNAMLVAADGIAIGLHEFSILANSIDIDEKTIAASLRVVDTSSAATLVTPVNGSVQVDTKPTLNWSVDGYVASVTIEIATEASFENIVATAQVTSGNSYRPSADLAQETVYFWRVTANNACGNESSSVFSFTTQSDKDISTELLNDSVVTISGAEDSTQNFYIDVPANVASLSVSTSGGGAGDDLDLYMSVTNLPVSNDDIICESESGTSTESCEIANPEEATYFILAFGYSTYANVNLTVHYELDDVKPIISSQVEINFDEDGEFELTIEDLTITDPDSSSFTLSIEAGSNYSFNGTVVKPDPNFNGELAVPIKVSDGNSDSDVFVVSMTVNSVYDVPKINTQSELSIDEDSSLELTPLLFNITAPDSDEIELIIEAGENYTVDGNIITPDANFYGDLSIVVKLNDGESESDPFDTLLSITSVNDLPSVINDNFTVEEGSSDNTFDVLSNDTDIDEGDMLTLSSFVYSGTGIVKINGNTLSYTPMSGFSGSETMQYTVTDNFGGAKTGTVSVTVNAKASGGGAFGGFILMMLMSLLVLRINNLRER